MPNGQSQGEDDQSESHFNTGSLRSQTIRIVSASPTVHEPGLRIGRSVNRFFIDPATSGKKRLHDRDAGRELMATLRSRETVKHTPGQGPLPDFAGATRQPFEPHDGPGRPLRDWLASLGWRFGLYKNQYEVFLHHR
jgi:hypothetical protein